MNDANVMTVESTAQVGERPHRAGLIARMVGAEFLKVRKRRGLVAWSAILTVVPVALFFAISAILHAEDPARYGPAGGVSNLAGIMGVLATLGTVAAVLIGATMGAGDVQAGVFRDLVSTGRSRFALFAARVPGGLALLWPLLAFAWAIACAASVAFAGDLAGPGIVHMIQGGGWVFLAVTSIYLLAVGVASLTASRSTTIGIVLAWLFAMTQLLLQITSLGAARQALQMAALTRLIPADLQEGPADPAIASMSVGMAILVVVAWGVVPLAAGAWRTRTRDA
jgi:ABC-type transport system involved in multi-copper enzyme maturation permease subunit